jgi:Protein of unknown function (DUF732)
MATVLYQAHDACGQTLRIYRRFLGTALVGGPLLVAGVVWASPAHADQTSYLNDLHNHGIHDFAGGDAAMVKQGWIVCNEIWGGESPGQLAAMALQRSDTVQGSKGLTPQQASDFVSYAVTDLCPNYYTNYRW